MQAEYDLNNVCILSVNSIGLFLELAFNVHPPLHFLGGRAAPAADDGASSSKNAHIFGCGRAIPLPYYIYVKAGSKRGGTPFRTSLVLMFWHFACRQQTRRPLSGRRAVPTAEP